MQIIYETILLWFAGGSYLPPHLFSLQCFHWRTTNNKPNNIFSSVVFYSVCAFLLAKQSFYGDIRKMLKYIVCGCMLITASIECSPDFEVYKPNAFERTNINTIMSLTTELRNEHDNVDRMVELMLQLQRQCEIYLEIEIDANDMFHSIFYQLEQQGYKFHQNYLKMFKQRLKVGKTKDFILIKKGPSQQTIDSWTIEPKHKSSKKKLKKLNPKMSHGITASLAGGFLSLLPSPPLVKLGKILFWAGMGYIVDGYFYDEEKKHEEGN